MKTTQRILLAIFALGLLFTTTSCTKTNDPVNDLKNQISYNGSIMAIIASSYYIPSNHTEFMFSTETVQNSMFNISSDLIDGNSHDITTLSETQQFDFHYNDINFSKGELLGWTGSFKVIKTTNPIKYVVTFEFKQGSTNSILANFDVTSGS